MAAPVAGRIGVEPEHPRRGDQLTDEGFDPLRARSMAGDRHRAAFGARLRDRFGVAAVVTADEVAPAVQDQRDVAVWAEHGRTAGAAAQVRGEPPAVEHHDGLRARTRIVAERAQCLAGRRMERAAAARDVAHVEHLDRGQRQRVHALRQLESIELGPALGTRGRRAGQIDGTGLGGAPAGDRPGVVAGIPLLLVGGVVLLVDDDQAEVAERREDRRAGTDTDPGGPGTQSSPLVEPLALREPGVEHGDAVAEPGRDPADRLRGEADLGDEQDRAAAPVQRRLDRGRDRPRSCPSR